MKVTAVEAIPFLNLPRGADLGVQVDPGKLAHYRTDN